MDNKVSVSGTYKNEIRIYGHLVIVQYCVDFSSGVSNGVPFAQVPEGFRPKENISVPAILNRNVALNIRINTNGDVLQNQFGSCTNVYIDTIYLI